MSSQLDHIGKTPILKLSAFEPGGNLFAKLESKNPLSSVKDRTAWGMIRHAERNGLLKKGSLLVEPTSGNTGIGLAWISRLRGYRLILTMPDSMSVERRKILAFLGAELVLTEGKKGMKGAVEEAEKIRNEGNAIFLDQFSNPGNPEIHYETTGPEIWDGMEGEIDIAVFGVGTGGTLSGAGRYLKEKNPKIKIIAVEPKESPVISGGVPAPHVIQGIGAGFVPKNLDRSLIERIETVSGDEAMSSAMELAKIEGIFAGISSGAAIFIARTIALENPALRVFTVLPDTAERYLSTTLFPPSK